MAIFRKIHTTFWSDSFISELNKDQKLFYIYLLTNDRTTQCGVYEITLRQISFDLGFGIDTVSKLLEYFIKTGKIKYNSSTNEVAIGNWLKYNSSTSPKVQSCINKEFAKVKDTVLIEYVKSMDIQPQEEQEEEQEQEEENNNLLFDKFWNLYPKKVAKGKCETKFKTLKKSDIEIIFKTLPDFIKYKPFADYTHPNPLTYLNQERWNDEIKITKQDEKTEQSDKFGESRYKIHRY